MGEARSETKAQLQHLAVQQEQLCFDIILVSRLVLFFYTIFLFLASGVRENLNINNNNKQTRIATAS